jgi:uncharacterized protein YbaR (Trm112 family)
VKDTVDTRYKEYIETTAKHEQLSRIVFAANITKEFFDTETEEVKQEVEIYREKLSSGGTIKLDGTADGDDTIDEEAQQSMKVVSHTTSQTAPQWLIADQCRRLYRAIDRLPQTLKNVLQAVEAQTGWPCFVITGGPCPKLGGKMQIIA